MKDHSNKDIELIRKLSQLMSKEKITKLKYEKSDLKLSIDKNTKSENVPSIHTHKSIEAETKENKTLETKTNFDIDHPGALKAPMVGTAYCSPEPGKEPFIKLNKSVSKGDTLLIIEAMKVMNTITAHKSGKVVFIGFEDNQPIEYNQLLLIIE